MVPFSPHWHVTLPEPGVKIPKTIGFVVAEIWGEEVLKGLVHAMVSRNTKRSPTLLTPSPPHSIIGMLNLDQGCYVMFRRNDPAGVTVLESTFALNRPVIKPCKGY